MTSPPAPDSFAPPAPPPANACPLAISAAPLALWPLVIIGNVMSLAGEPSRQPVAVWTMIAANGFLWGSTVYPLVYIAATALFLLTFRRYPAAASVISWATSAYAVGVFACFCLWVATGS
jgi:hypothetical protein